MADNSGAVHPEPPPQQQDVATVLGLDADGCRKGFFKRRRTWIVIALVATGAIAAALWLTVREPDGAVHYTLQKASRGNLTVTVTATGTVQPTNKVDVSSELSGIIRKVYVDYNSPIKVGQPLAELDTDKLKATVEASRAKLAAARAGVKESEATVIEKRLDYKRRKELTERQVGATRDLESAKAALDRAIAAVDSAKADVGAAQAQLQLDETNLTKACICSPIDGVVLKRNAEPGQTVASSFQAPVLFTIAEDLRKMEVQVDVDEADVGKVHEGQQATFTVDAYPDRKFAARIQEVRFGSEVVQGVVTYKAVLTADNSDLLLRPGMTATAEITVRKVNDALTVPNAAVRFSPPADNSTKRSGGILDQLIARWPHFRQASRPENVHGDRTVWVLEDGVPVRVPITVGVTDGQRTQILSGAIKPGQDVIVDAAQRRK